MPELGTDGIYRTQALETPSENNGATALPVANSPDEAQGWNNWFTASFNNHIAPAQESLTAGIADAVVEMFRERCTPLERRVRELEGRLAEATAMIDILCGKGAAGGVLRKEIVDSALKAVRADFEDRIKELELKLAQATGVLDTLRGRGVPGLPNVRGTFDPEKTYAHLDVVMHGGSSWVAVKDAPGELPGNGWQLLASCGKRGERGPRGAVGATGAPAPVWKSVWFDAKRLAFTTRMSDGSAGPELRLDLIFAGVDVDPATYSVNFKMLDGSELKFSLRGLFEQFFHEVTGR